MNRNFNGTWPNRSRKTLVFIGIEGYSKLYAPINVNPVGGGGGECGQGVGICQILKFFDQIPQGGKRKANQKCQKSPHPRGKNLNKQHYNTI